VEQMKKILLTKGEEALVDDYNYSWLMKWRWHFMPDRDSGGYAVRSVRIDDKVKIILMHVEIMKHAGHLEEGQVDHWDQNKLNNQEQNLRMATHTQQRANTKRYKNNTSGYKGVSFNKQKDKWVSYIRVDRKLKHLGYYDTPEEAAEAHNKEATKQFGEFACLNEIPRMGHVR
jgi:hypothetical protein